MRQSDLYDCIVSVLGGKLTAAALVPVPGAVKRNLDAQVLLVEDHPVNQELALAVLESLGCRTRLAQHGREALDLLAHTAFDLVLMDCQMPVMDGFEAVAEIRCREAAAGGAPRIPVIALTAGAIQGDREKCLAAGMDDYLTKPFSTEQLGVVLTRWLPAARRAASGPACATGPGAGAAPALASVPSAAPSASATQIDRRILERMQALQGGAAGAAFVRRIIGIYLGDASVRMGSLREAVARNDPAALARCAHALRSASATVGASALADLCRQMESLGQAALRDAAAGAGVPVTEGRADDWADGVAAGAAGAAGAASAAALLRAIDTSFALAAAELTTI